MILFAGCALCCLAYLSSDCQAAKHKAAKTAGSHPNAHIRLILQNGMSLEGYVDGEHVIEVYEIKKRIYRAPQEDERGGIRVWYTHKANGYTYFLLEDIADWKIIGEVSPESIAKIEETIKKKSLKDAQEGDRMRKAQLAYYKKKREDAKAKQDAKETKPAPSANKYEGHPLLEQYPPDQGWNKTRLNDIQKRRVIGVAVTQEEWAFIEQYEKWEKTLFIWLKEQQNALEQDTSGESPEKETALEGLKEG